LCSSLYISTAPSPSSIYTLSLHDALPILVVRGAIRANESHTFLLRRDDEIAALDLGVLQPVGVALQFAVAPPFAARVVGPLRKRSEEHTSELQSRGHLVCRLLLEKKNKKK